VSDELLLPLGEELLLEPLGEALLPEALPLVLESLEPDELGVEDELEELGEDDVPEELGVEDEELEELGELELGVDAPDALDELGLLLEESLLELELEPDIEPEGEDGEVLLELAPVEPERDAPGPPAPPRSQP
jgi:hypothetical protein